MKRGRCVALTGGIACGKSAAAEFWRRLGADVLDADDVVHGLLAAGGAAVGAVAAAFGPGVVGADGGIDRVRLGRIVFADESARRRLEGLLHPEVERRMRAWADEIRREGRVGVAVVPLLFEAGLEKGWDATYCVASGEQRTMERLAGRGLAPEEARARIASQWPVREKAARADRVIENDGSLAELEKRCREEWTHLVEQGD